MKFTQIYCLDVICHEVQGTDFEIMSDPYETLYKAIFRTVSTSQLAFGNRDTNRVIQIVVGILPLISPLLPA